jgi:plasmid replication initiation protein
LKTKLIDPEAKESSRSLVHWVDRIDYDAKTLKIQVRWQQDIVALFNNFGEDNPYSRYYLENTCKMKSIHSIRLFRILNKWWKIGKVRTEIEELKRLLGLSEGTYSDFKDLNQKVLKKSIEEINTLSNLEVEFKKNLGGRKVLWLDWEIRRKQ